MRVATISRLPAWHATRTVGHSLVLSLPLPNHPLVFTASPIRLGWWCARATRNSPRAAACFPCPLLSLSLSPSLSPFLSPSSPLHHSHHTRAHCRPQSEETWSSCSPTPWRLGSPSGGLQGERPQPAPSRGGCRRCRAGRARETAAGGQGAAYLRLLGVCGDEGVCVCACVCVWVCTCARVRVRACINHMR